MTPSQNVIKAIMITAQIYGREFTPESAEMYVMDLANYSEAQLLEALARCRKELRTFPTVADVIARIEDGRPNIEQAWAMIPKDEYSSIVWTTEMRDAFAAARPLLETDKIGARMAFREVYGKAISDARARGLNPVWEPSLGLDPRGRTAALEEAVRQGRISQDHAQSLIPQLGITPSVTQQLEGPKEPEPDLEAISNIVSMLTGKKIAVPTVQVEAKEVNEEERRKLLLEQARILKGENK